MRRFQNRGIFILSSKSSTVSSERLFSFAVTIFAQKLINSWRIWFKRQFCYRRIALWTLPVSLMHLSLFASKRSSFASTSKRISLFFVAIAAQKLVNPWFIRFKRKLIDICVALWALPISRIHFSLKIVIISHFVFLILIVPLIYSVQRKTK